MEGGGGGTGGDRSSGVTFSGRSTILLFIFIVFGFFGLRFYGPFKNTSLMSGRLLSTSG